MIHVCLHIRTSCLVHTHTPAGSLVGGTVCDLARTYVTTGQDECSVHTLGALLEAVYTELTQGGIDRLSDVRTSIRITILLFLVLFTVVLSLRMKKRENACVSIYVRTYIRWPAAHKFAGTKVNSLLILAQMMDRATRMGTVNIGRVYTNSGVLYVRVCMSARVNARCKWHLRLGILRVGREHHYTLYYVLYSMVVRTCAEPCVFWMPILVMLRFLPKKERRRPPTAPLRRRSSGRWCVRIM